MNTNNNASTNESQEHDLFDFQFNDPSMVIHLNYNPIHVSYAMLFNFIEEAKSDL